MLFGNFLTLRDCVLQFTQFVCINSQSIINYINFKRSDKDPHQDEINLVLFNGFYALIRRWINTGFLKIGTTIRGNVFVIGKDKKGNFISLNKSQFLKCIKLLINESFNYKTNNKKTKYIDKRNYNQNLNQYKVQENKLSNNDISKELILKILFTILDFVKNKMN